MHKHGLDGQFPLPTLFKADPLPSSNNLFPPYLLFSSSIFLATRSFLNFGPPSWKFECAESSRDPNNDPPLLLGVYYLHQSTGSTPSLLRSPSSPILFSLIWQKRERRSPSSHTFTPTLLSSLNNGFALLCQTSSHNIFQIVLTPWNGLMEKYAYASIWSCPCLKACVWQLRCTNGGSNTQPHKFRVLDII